MTKVRSGLGLEAQRAALAGAGDRDGWEIVAERVDEGVSRAGFVGRSGAALAAAVQLVDVGDADAVAIARLDRLAPSY